MTKLLTYKQVSEQLGIKLATLYAMVHRREIPHLRLGPRMVRFSLSEIEAWLLQKAEAGKL